MSVHPDKQVSHTNFANKVRSGLGLEMKSEEEDRTGCLREASSCVSTGKGLVAASKRRPAFFLLIALFVWTTQRKSKTYNCNTAS